MDLQTTFYILAIAFMILFIIVLVFVVVLLFFIKKKITQIHQIIEQKIELITHPSGKTVELAAGLGSAVADMALKKVSKVIRGKK